MTPGRPGANGSQEERIKNLFLREEGDEDRKEYDGNKDQYKVMGKIFVE